MSGQFWGKVCETSGEKWQEMFGLSNLRVRATKVIPCWLVHDPMRRSAEFVEGGAIGVGRIRRGALVGCATVSLSSGRFVDDRSKGVAIASGSVSSERTRDARDVTL